MSEALSNRYALNADGALVDAEGNPPPNGMFSTPWTMPNVLSSAYGMFLYDEGGVTVGKDSAYQELGYSPSLEPGLIEGPRPKAGDVVEWVTIQSGVDSNGQVKLAFRLRVREEKGPKSLRDELAVAALQGLCAHREAVWKQGIGYESPQSLARRAWELADAMVEARDGAAHA